MTQTITRCSPLPHAAHRIVLLFLISMLGFITTVSEALAASVSPNTLSYRTSSSAPTPSPQTVTFSKNSMVTKSWTASGNTSWITVSPSTGTISREKDQITVNVNASGLAGGTYNGTVNIAIGGQISVVSVTLVVSGGTATPTSTSGSTTSTSGGTTSTPSILLNPVSLSFSGTAGGAAPLAQTFNIANPTGGTLTWTLTEPASWLGLNMTSGTTTTEVDAISASVATTGLSAGTYSTAINVSASGSSNSPQTIPVTLTLTPPTTTGSATLTWSANTEQDLQGYRVYMGTQTGVYSAPVSVGNTTTYTVGNLTGGRTYYFSVTAVDSVGNESQYSSEVSKPVM
jgi:hypothetical protein